MTKRFLFYGTLLLLLASCSSLKQTTNTSKTLDIYGSGVIQSPVLTDLVVNPKKISSFYSGEGMQSVEYHKSQAIAKAMEENKADVIIEPAFEIVSSNSNVKITTTGYSGSYKNFRNMTAADSTILIDAGIINFNNNDATAPAYQSQKKKGKGALVILAVILGGVAAAAGAL